MRTRVRRARNGSCQNPNSWLALRGERVPQLVQSGTNPSLDGAERLIQSRSHFGVRQFGEEGGFNRLSFVRREHRERGLQRPALLFELENVVAVRRLGRGQDLGFI